MEFFIVQHGEKARVSGDPPLTPTGIAQARQTGAYLRTWAVTRLYSSPLRRTRETATLVGEALSVPVEVDDRLRERMNWGDGLPAQPLEAFLRDWERTTLDRDFTPAAGDSSSTAGARFAALLEELAGRYAGERIVLVTHGGVTVDLLRSLFTDGELRHSTPDRLAWPEVLRGGVPPCAITRLIRHSGVETQYELRALASDAHLRVTDFGATA